MNTKNYVVASSSCFFMATAMLATGCGSPEDNASIQQKIDEIESLYDPSTQGIIYNPAKASDPALFLGDLFLVYSNNGVCPDSGDLTGANENGSIIALSGTGNDPWIGPKSDKQVVRSLSFSSKEKGNGSLNFGKVLGGLKFDIEDNESLELVVRKETQSVVETAEYQTAREDAVSKHQGDANICYIYTVTGYTHLIVDKRVFTETKNDDSIDGNSFLKFENTLYVSTENISTDDIFLLELNVEFRGPQVKSLNHMVAEDETQLFSNVFGNALGK